MHFIPKYCLRVQRTPSDAVIAEAGHEYIPGKKYPGQDTRLVKMGIYSSAGREDFLSATELVSYGNRKVFRNKNQERTSVLRLLIFQSWVVCVSVFFLALRSGKLQSPSPGFARAQGPGPSTRTPYQHASPTVLSPAFLIMWVL